LHALSLFLSSEFCVYHQFFNSPKWGIDENLADLSTLLKIPVPVVELTESGLSSWSLLRDQLIDATVNKTEGLDTQCPQLAKRLQVELNDRVYKLLGLRQSERWLIEDFVNIHMELNKGKFSPEVARTPTAEEQMLYLKSLRECLDGFFAADRGVRHKLEVLADRESTLMAVSLVKSKTAIEPVVIASDDPASRDLKVIRDRLRTKHSQWVYFDRNLKVYDRRQGVLYQFKPLQRLQWTRRQAVLDADDIIAETLSEAGVS